MRLMALATTETPWPVAMASTCTSDQARMRRCQGATRVVSLSTLKIKVVRSTRQRELTCITALLAVSRGALVKDHLRDEGIEREKKRGEVIGRDGLELTLTCLN